jgi:hypothetical protein
MTTNRAVDLTGLSEGLTNVKSYNPYSALVGSSGGAPAILGAVDPAAIISNEVRSYVATLIRRGQVDLSRPGAAKPRNRKRTGRGAGYLSETNRPTHALRRRGDELVLERLCFACGCHPLLWRGDAT